MSTTERKVSFCTEKQKERTQCILKRNQTLTVSERSVSFCLYTRTVISVSLVGYSAAQNCYSNRRLCTTVHIVSRVAYINCCRYEVVFILRYKSEFCKINRFLQNMRVFYVNSVQVLNKCVVYSYLFLSQISFRKWLPFSSWPSACPSLCPHEKF